MTFTRRAVVQGLGYRYVAAAHARAWGQSADLTTRVIPKSKEALPWSASAPDHFQRRRRPRPDDECCAVIAASSKAAVG